METTNPRATSRNVDTPCWKRGQFRSTSGRPGGGERTPHRADRRPRFLVVWSCGACPCVQWGCGTFATVGCGTAVCAGRASATAAPAAGHGGFKTASRSSSDMLAEADLETDMSGTAIRAWQYGQSPDLPANSFFTRIECPLGHVTSIDIRHLVQDKPQGRPRSRRFHFSDKLR